MITILNNTNSNVCFLHDQDDFMMAEINELRRKVTSLDFGLRT